MLLKPDTKKKVHVQVLDGTKTKSSSFTVYETTPDEFCRAVCDWLKTQGRRTGRNQKRAKQPA